MTILEMTLTEQWKAGKLEEFYGKPFYIKKQNGVVKVDYLCKYGFVNNYDVVEVLAPCDYEELQEKQKSLKVLAEAYCKEKEENQQLKELLKKLHRDAQEIVLYSHDIADIDQEDWFTISRRQANIANNITKDIYNVIGEKNNS